MSEPSSNSEQQPESPLSRINQHSGGDSRGGQQAAIGDNINQSQDNSTHFNIFNFFNYDELQDKDLEPLSLQGKILSYFGVFVVLALTLVFWFFFGLFINFPFPYHQVIELIISCFRGNVGPKINRLQRELQSKSIDSESIKELTEIDFQARLYLLVLERLGADKAESHERLAKTIEVLRQTRSRLQERIKPQQPKEYQAATRAQDFVESITLSQTAKDLIEIEAILNEVASSIRNDYPSETIIKDTIIRLSEKITCRASRISPSRLGTLYRIQALLSEVADKNISNLEETELNDINRRIISDLQEQKNTLSRKLEELLSKHDTAEQRLENYSEELHSLNNLIDEREADLLKLQEKLKNYSEINRNKQEKINQFNTKLIEYNEKIRELQTQKITLIEKINQLNKDLHQKQTRIDQLSSQLNRYSEIRIPKGRYIGNLSAGNTKYHFNPKCPTWKMLVGDYVLKLDLDASRGIVTSDTPTFFTGKLEECSTCADKKVKPKRY